MWPQKVLSLPALGKPYCEHVWEGPESPTQLLQLQPDSRRDLSSLFRVSGEAEGLMKKHLGFRIGRPGFECRCLLSFL